MRTLRLLFVMTFCLGMSLISYGQAGINDLTTPKDSIPLMYKQVDCSNLDISIHVLDKWEVLEGKKETTLKLKHSGSKSNIEISTVDMSEALDYILTKDKEKTNELMSLVESYKPNLKVNFSKTDKEIVNGYEQYTGYKTINKQAFLITAKIDQSCVDCKNDFEAIVESIQTLK